MKLVFTHPQTGVELEVQVSKPATIRRARRIAETILRCHPGLLSITAVSDSIVEEWTRTT